MYCSAAGLLLCVLRPGHRLSVRSIGSLPRRYARSYQEAIRLYETEEAYQGLPFTDEVLATLNYHTSVSSGFFIAYIVG